MSVFEWMNRPPRRDAPARKVSDLRQKRRELEQLEQEIHDAFEGIDSVALETAIAEARRQFRLYAKEHIDHRF